RITRDPVIGLQPDVVAARRDRADKGQARQARNRVPLVGGNRCPVVGQRAVGRIPPLRPTEPNMIFGDAATVDRVDAAEWNGLPSSDRLVGRCDYRRWHTRLRTRDLSRITPDPVI